MTAYRLRDAPMPGNLLIGFIGSEPTPRGWTRYDPTCAYRIVQLGDGTQYDFMVLEFECVLPLSPAQAFKSLSGHHIPSSKLPGRTSGTWGLWLTPGPLSRPSASNADAINRSANVPQKSRASKRRGFTLLLQRTLQPCE